MHPLTISRLTLRCPVCWNAAGVGPLCRCVWECFALTLHWCKWLHEVWGRGESGSQGLLTRWQIINDGVQYKCNSRNSEIRAFSCQAFVCHLSNKPPAWKGYSHAKASSITQSNFCSGFPQNPKSVFPASTSSILRHVQERDKRSQSRNGILRLLLPKSYWQALWQLAAILEGLQGSTVLVHLPFTLGFYLCRTSPGQDAFSAQSGQIQGFTVLFWSFSIEWPRLRS